jgi:hypothetical protein
MLTVAMLNGVSSSTVSVGPFASAKLKNNDNDKGMSLVHIRWFYSSCYINIIVLTWLEYFLNSIVECNFFNDPCYPENTNAKDTICYPTPGDSNGNGYCYSDVNRPKRPNFPVGIAYLDSVPGLVKGIYLIPNAPLSIIINKIFIQ